VTLPSTPLALLAALLALFSVAQDEKLTATEVEEMGFKIVVAPEVPIESIERRTLAQIFIGKMTHWSDGGTISPVDQSARSEVRLAFCRHVLKSVGLSHMSSVRQYWQQEIFSGRGTPPPVRASDLEVAEYVAANPGAIGYVAADAEVKDVKVVQIR
jgi:ABC-type phosphate transport system substrate-binding protein